MAATVPVEKVGDVNHLLEAAGQIGVTTNPEDDERDTQPTAKVTDPKVGSYEAFMSTFGNPKRWAGR